MTKTINKIELRKRCEGLAKQTKPRVVQNFTCTAIMGVLKELNLTKLAPRFKYNYRQNRGYGLTLVFKTYLKHLIEESLKYPIDIYIPKIGLLKIREIDSIGKRRIWREGDDTKYRFDTPFDKSVMYRVYHQIFGLENNNYKTPFKLHRGFASSIVGKVYKLHPKGGYYEKYIKTKS